MAGVFGGKRRPRPGEQFTVRLPVNPRGWAGGTRPPQEAGSAPILSGNFRGLVVDDNRYGRTADRWRAWSAGPKVHPDQAGRSAALREVLAETAWHPRSAVHAPKLVRTRDRIEFRGIGFRRLGFRPQVRHGNHAKSLTQDLLSRDHCFPG